MTEAIQKKLQSMDKREMASMVEDNLNCVLFFIKALQVVSYGDRWEEIFEDDEATYAIAQVYNRLDEIRAAYLGHFPFELRVVPRADKTIEIKAA